VHYAVKTRAAVKQADFKILNAILKGKFITPVYQPIVSLSDGQIFGYEALSRIPDNSPEIKIESLFRFVAQCPYVENQRKCALPRSVEMSLFGGKNQ